MFILDILSDLEIMIMSIYKSNVVTYLCYQLSYPLFSIFNSSTGYTNKPKIQLLLKAVDNRKQRQTKQKSNKKTIRIR